MDPMVFSEFANEIIKMSGLLGTDKSFIAGLTPKQVHIIMEIGTQSIRHGDLASSLGVDPSTLTRTLDPLDKAGIVHRRPNPDNRREVLIQLSDKGSSVLMETQKKMSDHLAQILKHIPKDKSLQVESSIILLLNVIKQLSKRN